MSPSPLARLNALTPAQRRTVLAASIWLPFFWFGLRMCGLSRQYRWLQQGPLGAEPVPRLMLSEIQALGEAVNIAARHSPFPATCLTRSLLLAWLLQRRGVGSQLRIGVRFTHGVLSAHAWIECEGVPVNDQPNVSKQFVSFGDLVPLKAFHTP